TSITEVYQSGGTPPGAGAWGCENAGSQSKYVGSLATDANGAVTAKIQGISTDVNGKFVTLVPLNSAGAAAHAASDMGTGLSGWSCGGTGTDVNKKYLPGSCRG